MEKLAAVIWGVPTMMLLLLVGILLSVRTRFVQLRMLWPSICHVCRSAAGKGKSSFRAVCTALAGTVGTGNVAGVAGAIALGGPGALFWMWISAFFGMATKYAEVVLAVRYREKGDDGSFRGGPMYYIRHGMGERWKPMAAVFALFAMLSSFGMGNMAQVHTIVSAIRTALPQVRPEPLSLLIGLITALLVLWMTADGGRSVGSLMERLVPVMAVVYVLGAGAVIWCHRMELDTVFRAVCFGAFSPEAVLGGGAGIGLQQTIRWGVARGIFSNEAGLGSAPIAHAAAEATPEEQGLFGVFEVFLDTHLVQRCSCLLWNNGRGRIGCCCLGNGVWKLVSRRFGGLSQHAGLGYGCDLAVLWLSVCRLSVGSAGRDGVPPVLHCGHVAGRNHGCFDSLGFIGSVQRYDVSAQSDCAAGSGKKPPCKTG